MPVTLLSKGSSRLRIQFALSGLPRLLARPLSIASDVRSNIYNTKTPECTPDDLYSYTAQRWAWNEYQQLQRRYVQFDFNALIKVAEEAARDNAVCSNISRLPEGNFNKTFMVTMQDGRQLVVKIPNPNAGLSYFTTASEVATMSYARDKLEIPAPKVLAYCTKASESKLGVEYIIMEKAQGIELRRIWGNMRNRQKVDLVKSLATITAKLSHSRFPACGSLYYQRDLEDSNGIEIDDTYAIGPSTGRSWFDDRRGEIDVYRGPWHSSSELMIGLVQRETSCLRAFPEFPRDRQQGIYNGPDGYHPTKETKLSVLRDFLKIMPHILPTEEFHFLNDSIIWHNDLHLGNIFVDEANPTKITSIIDWQAITTYPMFLTVRQPSMVDHEWEKSDDFNQPEGLPSNILELEPEQQKKEKKRHLEQSLWTLYEIQTQMQAPDLLYAFRYTDILPCQILRSVGVTFDDGEQHVQSLLTALVDKDGWKQVVGTNQQGKPNVSCPLSYSQDQIDKQEFEYAKWERDVERKARILSEIGVYIGWTGATAPHEYDEVIRRLDKAKKRFLDREASTPEERKRWEKVWPFKDDEKLGKQLINS